MQEDWAKIDELADLDGNLIGPLDITGWYVPEVVNLQGDDLVWDWFSTNARAGQEANRIRATSELLGNFIRLHDADDDRILKFARKWGMLYLCEHGLPARHTGDVCLPLGKWIGLNGRNHEPIEGWRIYSRKAHELLNEAAKLYEEIRNRNIDHDLLNRQGRVAKDIQLWLDQAGTNVEFFWAENKQRVKLGTHSLFGALSVQLMALVSKTRGLAICSNCGEIYIPSRSPRTDQRNYCDKEECRNLAAWRDAKRHERRKGEAHNER